MTRSVPEAIEDGTAALARMQSRDGSFPLWRGTTQWQLCGPLFSTAYIMMGEAAGLLPRDAIDRAVIYILRQRRRDRLWEYDPALRIPPDSESTSCALATLVRRGDPADVADGIDLLRSFWRYGAGPFRTWKAKGMWSQPDRDDPVVNCNIIYALRLLGTPGIHEAQAAVLRQLQRVPRSRYYCSPATIAHAARRAGIPWNDLPAHVTALPDPAGFLGCAQWLCASPLGDDTMLAAVLAAQQADGSWPVAPWVTAAEHPRPFWGSPAVSTALALEALLRRRTGASRRA